MEVIEVTLGLLLAVALVGAIGKLVPVPLPILQVAAGVGLSFLPLFASLNVPPEVFFLLFIPPLLFADAWVIPKRDLLGVLRPVLLLAFGLVLFTVVVVGYLLHWLLPALPLAAAFALGAVISPTDAVAVSAVTGKLKLPARMTTILKGESLINDASGLVAFKFAAAAVVTGAFSWSDAALQLFLLSGGGFALGLAMAWAIGRLRAHLVRFCIGDPTIQTVISLLTPYAAYLAAEALGLGGILAVVGAGLYAGVDDSRNVDLATRTHAWEVWTMLSYAFNGLVFLLLGVGLHAVVADIPRESVLGLVLLGVALTAVVILLRIAWVYPAAYLPPLMSRRIREREGFQDPRSVFVVGWAGIRGSVTLAAALSLPLVTATGAPFPGRELIILLASGVIVITLVFNGLTLRWLIRWLHIRGDGIAEREERAARLATAHAAALAIRQELPRLSEPGEVAYAQALLEEYERRAQHHSANAERRIRSDAAREAERRLRLAALRAERAELMQLRDTEVINDEVLRIIQADLDHVEALVSGSTPRGG
ncbi:MAG: Na+/H+ antiporter [Betaproteobacteria bacterium]|nr:MAG: Na+/H+ antiporter [Betaproteobacteria bacterium]